MIKIENESFEEEGAEVAPNATVPFVPPTPPCYLHLLRDRALFCILSINGLKPTIVMHFSLINRTCFSYLLSIFIEFLCMNSLFCSTSFCHLRLVCIYNKCWKLVCLLFIFPSMGLRACAINF